MVDKWYRADVQWCSKEKPFWKKSEHSTNTPGEVVISKIEDLFSKITVFKKITGKCSGKLWPQRSL